MSISSFHADPSVAAPELCPVWAWVQPTVGRLCSLGLLLPMERFHISYSSRTHKMTNLFFVIFLGPVFYAPPPPLHLNTSCHLVTLEMNLDDLNPFAACSKVQLPWLRSWQLWAPNHWADTTQWKQGLCPNMFET